MQIESEVKCKYLLSCLRVDLSIFLSVPAALFRSNIKTKVHKFSFHYSVKKF